MPSALAPPEQSDYRFMGLADWNQLYDVLTRLPELGRYYILNAFQRLHDVAWITRKLAEDVKQQGAVVGQESLHSLQIYLLVTCADILGHILEPQYTRVRERFCAFFENLSNPTKQMLLEELLVLEERWANPSESRFADDSTGNIVQPHKRHQIERPVLDLSDEERLAAVVDYLYYARRNPYTHEAEFPQLGHHPNLSVLHNHRLGVPRTATLGDSDRIQLFARAGEKGSIILYFAYLAAPDPVLHLRQIIVSGLGEILRSKAGVD